MKQKYIFTLILISYIIGMIVFASLPGLENLGLISKYDKVFHLVEFFILTLILLKSISFFNLKNEIIIVFVFAFFIAIITELVQFLIPSRSFSWLDIVFDIAGIFLALLIRLKG